MDERARIEAIRDGLEADRLVVTGQPHFETIALTSESIGPGEVQAIRARLGVGPADSLLTFASEPISDTYGGAEAGRKFWGYNERTTFDALLKGVKVVAERYAVGVRIVIRPHPKEDTGYFENLVKNHKDGGVSLRIDTGIDSIELIKASDLVCGMSSMFLIEAALVNTPVVSAQIGLKRDNPFVLDRMGVVRSVLEPSSLEVELERFIVRHERPYYGLSSSHKAAERIVTEVEISLCRSSQ
jgi:hypothetical protein